MSKPEPMDYRAMILSEASGDRGPAWFTLQRGVQQDDGHWTWTACGHRRTEADRVLAEMEAEGIESCPPLSTETLRELGTIRPADVPADAPIVTLYDLLEAQGDV